MIIFQDFAAPSLQNNVFTRDALRGIPCHKTGRFLFFFSFVVTTNLHIGAVRPLLILSFIHIDFPKYSASRQLTLLSFQINVTMTRKMKTTEKHSQLNEFRVGFAQQSGVDN